MHQNDMSHARVNIAYCSMDNCCLCIGVSPWVPPSPLFGPIVLGEYWYICILRLQKMQQLLFLLLFVSYNCQVSYSNVFEIPAKNGTSTNAQLMMRSASISGQTVLLKDGSRLDLTFQLKGSSPCSLNVSDLRYSNDGASEMIGIYVLDKSIAANRTRKLSDDGLLWNKFWDTGPFGTTQYNIAEGVYNLTLIVFHSNDAYGVEIDSVTLMSNCVGTPVSVGDIALVESQQVAKALSTQLLISIIFNIVQAILFCSSIIINILNFYYSIKREKHSKRSHRGRVYHTENEDTR